MTQHVLPPALTFALTLAALAGCSSTDRGGSPPPPPPGPGPVDPPDVDEPRPGPGMTEARFKSGPIELPRNYGENTSMRNLVLVTTFHDEIDPSSGLRGVAPDLSTFLQAELGRIGRFSVFCLHNDGTYYVVEDLREHGIVGAKPVPPPPSIDLYLSGTVTATHGDVQLRSGNRHHTYQVSAAVELQDARRIQVWGRNLHGSKVRRTTVMGTQRPIEGTFDPSNKDDVAKALNESSRVLLYSAVSELGHQFPVTGEVTAFTEEQLAMDKGVADGVANEQQFVVWHRGTGGLDTALCYGLSSSGGASRTQIMPIYGEGERTRSAKALLEQIIATPNWLAEHPGSLFATTIGLGVPPEWSQARAQEAAYDEQLQGNQR